MQKFTLYRNLLVIATSSTLWFAPALLHATELHPLIVTGIALDKVATVHPAPVYPRVALALGIEGIVQIEVTVQNGRIIEANVISGSPLLAYSAKEWIVWNWKFKPERGQINKLASQAGKNAMIRIPEAQPHEILLSERSVHRVDWTLGVEIERRDDIEFRGIAKFLFEAASERAVIDLVVTSLADSPIIKDVRSLVLTFQYEVYDPSHGVCTINRATAIVENRDTSMAATVCGPTPTRGLR